MREAFLALSPSQGMARCPEKPGWWCRLPMYQREGALVVREGTRAQRLDAGVLLAVEGRHRRRTAGLRRIVRAVKPQAKVVLVGGPEDGIGIRDSRSAQVLRWVLAVSRSAQRQGERLDVED